MPVNSDTDIVNQALARIGASPIPSLDAPGPAGHIPKAVYTAVRDDILSKYPWHFTWRFAELTRKGAAPNSWRSEYHLPPQRLALPRAYYETATNDRPVTRFELLERTVCADTDTLFAKFQIVPQAPHMPAYFTELLVLAIAAELALAIREDRTLRATLRENAYGSEMYQGEGGQFAIATTLDAQANPSPEIDGGRNPIHDARWTDGGDLRSVWAEDF